MTKSFDWASPSVNRDQSDRLIKLMEQEGISLIRASQILRIPYYVAKQILFTHGS